MGNAAFTQPARCGNRRPIPIWESDRKERPHSIASRPATKFVLEMFCRAQIAYEGHHLRDRRHDLPGLRTAHAARDECENPPAARNRPFTRRREAGLVLLDMQNQPAGASTPLSRKIPPPRMHTSNKSGADRRATNARTPHDRGTARHTACCPSARSNRPSGACRNHEADGDVGASPGRFRRAALPRLMRGRRCTCRAGPFSQHGPECTRDRATPRRCLDRPSRHWPDPPAG